MQPGVWNSGQDRYLQIAELKLLETDYKSVTEYAQKALDFNRFNIPARECLATAFRKMNKVNESVCSTK